MPVKLFPIEYTGVSKSSYPSGVSAKSSPPRTPKFVSWTKYLPVEMLSAAPISKESFSSAVASTCRLIPPSMTLWDELKTTASDH